MKVDVGLRVSNLHASPSNPIVAVPKASAPIRPNRPHPVAGPPRSHPSAFPAK